MRSRSIARRVSGLLASVVIGLLAEAISTGWHLTAHAAEAARPGAGSGWTLSPPQQHGISAAALDELREHMLRAEPSIRALLVQRHGQPVFEYYRKGLDAQTLHPVHSVTKSVVSTLVGVAIAQGRLDTADRPLASLLDEAKAPGTASEVAQMTLADLLTQRSGFERIGDQHGWSSAFTARYPRSPVMDVALLRPVQAPPGTRFLYSNLDTHLVSVALGRRLGMPIADFARDALFAPLGIREWVWPLVQGQTAGAGNLLLSARDLMRLGQLWLQQGRWQGRTLIDPDYFRKASSTLVTDLGPEYPSRGPSRIGYGYLFWTAEGLRPGWKSFYAAGMGGQFVLVVPTHDLVIVALTDPDDWSPEKSAANTSRLVRERLVPAIAD